MDNPKAPVAPGSFRRIKTYINGFDENIQGGMPEGHVALVSGAAGTMKSSVCFNVLYNEAVHGHSGLFVSLEQSADSFMKHVENMGYDMSRINLILIDDLATMASKVKQTNNPQAGKLILVDVGAIRKEIRDTRMSDNKSWLNVVKNIVKMVKEQADVELFVLDSLSALYVLSRFENPRIELFYIFEFLRDLGMTTFLISEIHANSASYGEYDIEDFLSDTIIHIRLTPFRRSVVREISVVKMRGTKTNNDIFSLEFKDGRFQALYGGQNPLL
ncbi:RAD55 family ATPase [Nanoarchaeota archaeon]